MGSRIKNFFLGKNNTSTSQYNITNTNASNPHLRGQSYENTIALEPPLKGSYSVSGNGRNVLNEIQQAQAARAKRLSKPGSVSARSTASPHVVRRVDDVPARPRTATGNGAAFGGGEQEQRGRTRTYSMKSRRVSVFSFHRQDSTRSTESEPPPLPKPARDIPTYKPAGSIGGTAGMVPEGFTPPYSQHSRTSSHASRSTHVDLLDAHSQIGPSSRKAYVDLLDAHSNITQSRERPLPRTKASGQRDYGEDVADRNITKHGERDPRDSRLDINVPELSYLKSVYPQKKGRLAVAGVEGSPSRAASALGHILGNDDAHDDTTPNTQPTATQPPQAKSLSIRSRSSQSRPGTVFPPPRLDSRTHTNRVRDDASATTSNGTVVPDARGRRISPLATSTTSINENPPVAPPIRHPRRHSVGNSLSRGRSPFRLKEPPPIPPPSTVPRDTSVHSRQTSNTPAPPPSAVPRATPVHSRQTSNTSAARESSKPERRTMSATHESTVVAPTPKRSKSQRSSYTAFPNTSQTKEHKGNRDSAVQRASQTPSLNSVVDLTNTVDTDVTTKTLPAVTHEHVTPQRHEIRREAVTREIHTHDVYHRVLPVIETEILPAKHYIKAADGSLVPIPESEVPRHSISGKSNGDWEVAKKDGGVDLSTALQRPHTQASSAEDGATPPAVGYTRGQPRSTRSRRNSLKSMLEPILSSKKEYVTKEGYPRTEYVWGHPPVFETADGNTQPMYIGAGLGDISTTDSGEIGAAKTTKGEEALLFRYSGYGSEGMLPGLKEKSPMAELGRGRVVVAGTEGGLGKSVGKVKVDGNSETNAKETRRKPVGETERQSESVAEMEKGVRKLSMRH